MTQRHHSLVAPFLYFSNTLMEPGLSLFLWASVMANHRRPVFPLNTELESSGMYPHPGGKVIRSSLSASPDSTGEVMLETNVSPPFGTIKKNSLPPPVSGGTHGMATQCAFGCERLQNPSPHTRNFSES